MKISADYTDYADFGSGVSHGSAKGARLSKRGFISFGDACPKTVICVICGYQIGFGFNV